MAHGRILRTALPFQVSRGSPAQSSHTCSPHVLFMNCGWKIKSRCKQGQHTAAYQTKQCDLSPPSNMQNRASLSAEQKQQVKQDRRHSQPASCAVKAQEARRGDGL